ncbi:MAG: hypothetical protein ABIP53_02510 [Candidatus Limnocylindrales bacterium]
MSEAVLTAVVRAFDLCVIECLPPASPFDLGRAGAGDSRPGQGPAARHSVLLLLTPRPDWLAGVFTIVQDDARTALLGAVPFLDHFLVEAEAVWYEGHPASATSEPFVALVGGTDVLLRARAVTQHERRLLILQRLAGDADLRPMLQRAREQMLEHEQLVQRTSTLHAPAAAIDRQVRELLAALPAEHQGVVDRLSNSSAELQSALAGLPAPPSRHRRQARKPTERE